MAKRILDFTPNADRYAIAPYVVHRLQKEHMDFLKTDDELFRWYMAYPLHALFDNPLGNQGKVMHNTKVEYSVYEVNYHITSGDAPLEPRNKVAPSLGGAISIANYMLGMIKNYQIRTQCFFSFLGPAMKTKVGNVKLWGAVLSMRKGNERFRPQWHAMAMVNRAIGGDLLETLHTGHEPTFQAFGTFRHVKRPINVEYPVLYSYAFKDDNKIGLVLVNLDIKEAQEVKLVFPFEPIEKARMEILTADRIDANNEFETGEPQINPEQKTINSFKTGFTLKVPAHSLISLTWPYSEKVDP